MAPERIAKLIERAGTALGHTFAAKGVGIGERLAAPMADVVKKGSPSIRAPFESAIDSVKSELVTAIDREIERLTTEHSPISPETSTIAALTIGGGSLTAFVGLAAAGSAIEGATLGQLEIPGTFLLQIGAMYGLGKMVGSTVNVPYHWGVEVGHNYYWASKFTPMIPGPSDLVRFELREVWRPEFREELLKPPPTEHFMKLMAYQGYAREVAEDYWAAHWDLPSVSQGYDAFHRLRPGRVDPKLEFTEEDLRALMRRLDILPRYHDQLIYLAYSPLTRVDVRRMYRCGVLDRDGVKQAYLDIGYHPDDAELMTDFTVKYESRDEERTVGHPELIQLAKEGFITSEQFKERSKELYYSDEDIVRYAKVAELRYEYDYKLDLLNMNRDLFRRGKITETECRVRLRTIGLSDERINVYIERDMLRIKITVAEEEQASLAKALTRTDVLRLYQTNVKTEEWARDKLEAFGYSLEDVDALLDMYSPAKPEVGGRSLSRAMLDRAFKDGIIDENYYLARLLDMGYSEEDAWIWYLVQIRGAAQGVEEE